MYALSSGRANRRSIPPCGNDERAPSSAQAPVIRGRVARGNRPGFAPPETRVRAVRVGDGWQAPDPAARPLASTTHLVVDSKQLAKASASVSWENHRHGLPWRPASSSHRLIWSDPGRCGLPDLAPSP